MGIYIKGMEMPKSCYQCAWIFRDKPKGKVYCTATDPESRDASKWLDLSETLSESRHDNCPLVYVPPHGRTIDADTLYTEMEKYTDDEGARGLHDVDMIHRDSILYAIEQAITIIPAEK